MKDPKASRQKATGSKSRVPLPSGKSVTHGANRRWTETETHFLYAYLQWSVNHQVDFFTVAIPKFIKATSSGLEKQQIWSRLKYLRKRYRLSEVTWEEFLKIGPNALRLPDETVEQFKRILDSIPSLDAEPLQGTREAGTGEDDAIAFQPTSEHVQQIEVADDKGPSNEQHTIARNPICEQSAHSKIDQKQTPANMSPSNKRKTADLENQLFVSQNETAYFKRRLEELPGCSPDAAAIDTLKGYLATNTRLSSWAKTFDVNNPGMPEDVISHAYAALFEQIQSTCSHIVALDGVMPDSEIGFSELAQLWAYQTFKKDLARFLQDDVENVYSKEDLLVGLIAAALIEHVFEPTFPSILQSSWLTSNPYRQFILNNQGANELHRADCSALPMLMSDQKSGIIDRKVEELHEVLSKSLQPFWDSQVYHRTQDMMGGDDANRVEMPAPGPDLRPLLHSAVKLKYRLTSSTTRLKFLSFQAQDPFDEKRMVRCKGSDPNGWRIKVCFLPVLLYPPPRPANASSVEYLLEHNVNYNIYFTKVLTGNPLCLDVAAKAIVLT